MVASNSLEPSYWISMPVFSSKSLILVSNFTWSASTNGPNIVTLVPLYSPFNASSSGEPVAATSFVAVPSFVFCSVVPVLAGAAGSLFAALFPPPQALRRSVNDNPLTSSKEVHFDLLFIDPTSPSICCMRNHLKVWLTMERYSANHLLEKHFNSRMNEAPPESVFILV
ncbi:hypothetical protein D3C74_333830 [compost metagenome]